MSKIVNLQIDEGASFTKALRFTRQVKTGEYKHPITNTLVDIINKEPISLVGYTLAAQIRAKADPNSALLATFSAGIASGVGGLAYISLSKEQTSRLGIIHNLGNTDTHSKRVYTLGYYDVLLTAPTGEATRVYEGMCYLNRAVTQNPLSVSNIHTTVSRSPIVEIGKEVILNVDSSNPHYFVGVRYLNSGVQVTPSGGYVNIYRKPATASSFRDEPIGTLAATSPESELSWYGNTKQIKAKPVGITGAASYQIVVVSNRS